MSQLAMVDATVYAVGDPAEIARLKGQTVGSAPAGGKTIRSLKSIGCVGSWLVPARFDG